MKIILLKDIAKVGKRYDVKEMSDGYAQNMLIPRGLALAATGETLKRIELEKARDEGERKLRNDIIVKNLTDLDGKTVTVTEKLNEKGHLFAGLHKAEIAKAIERETKLQIDPEFIVLDKPLKEGGVHEIVVKSERKTVKFNLEIKAR